MRSDHRALAAGAALIAAVGGGACTGGDHAPPAALLAGGAETPAATAGPGARPRPAWLRRPKIDPRIGARFRYQEQQRVIVSVADPLGEQAHPAAAEPAGRQPRASRREQRRGDLQRRKAVVLERLERATGRAPAVIYRYEAFRLVALAADAAEVAALGRDPEVTAIFADEREQAQLDQSLPFIAAPWFQQNRAAGAGTAVAVLDTPIRYDNGYFGTCPSVGAPGCSVAEWLSFSAETPAEVLAKEDQYGQTSHGTNVAAIVLGVAPDTTLLGLNVFHSDDQDQDTYTSPSDQIAALDWVAQNAAAYSIVAVNMSLGATRDDPWPCNHDDARYDPIRTLRNDYDILTAIASGNSGEQNAVKAPGCISHGVTVGAQLDSYVDDYSGSCDQTGYAGEIACFSNLNGMVDLIAPGLRVTAGGLTKSGTSMATPHVAGAIAAWQSWFLTQDGSFKSGFWMYRRLLADSSAPLLHRDGRRFHQLKLDQHFEWSYAHGFSWWSREAVDNLIPSAAPGFVRTAEVSGQGWTVAGVYLHLEVVHLSPQDVEVTLESPSGAAATVTLPPGQANFNGIIGRMVLPGAFAALAGSPADGTWTISLRDTVQADQGNYLQATLLLVEQGCTPSCDDAGCGDDRCGGSCGEICLIEGGCRLEGATQPESPCFACDPQASWQDWSARSGAACDDGDPCTEPDSCLAGLCGGSRLTCPPPAPCHAAGHCDSGSGECVYARRDDGTGCDDGDQCTTGDACQQGVCRGSPVACPPPPPCRQDGICLPAEGCFHPAAADGTACPGGTCTAGECTAAAAAERSGCGCRLAVRRRSSRAAAWLILLGGAWLRCGRRRRSRR